MQQVCPPPGPPFAEADCAFGADGPLPPFHVDRWYAALPALRRQFTKRGDVWGIADLRSKFEAALEQEAARLIVVALPAETPATHAPPPEQYVTLDKMAAIVGRSKRTLEKLKTRGRNSLPPPDIEGGGGRADEWLWATVRPWLEGEYGRELPERFPGDRFLDARADRS